MTLPASTKSPTTTWHGLRSSKLVPLIALVLLVCWVRPGWAARGAQVPPPTQTGSVAASRGGETTSPAKAITITPSTVAVAIGEPQLLRLADDRGQPIRDAEWALSDPTVAEIQTDGEVTVTGLAPGKVTITVTWRGLSARAQVRVLGSATPSGSGIASSGKAIAITPSRLSLIVEEPGWLRLNDEHGHLIRDARWVVSNTSLGEIRPGTDATLTGLAPGKFTVTAFWQGQSAEARVNVFPGPELPQGTIRWSLEPIPGYSTVRIVQAQPAGENTPDLYAIEQDACGRVMARALTFDGREMWRQSQEAGTAASFGSSRRPASPARPPVQRFPRPPASSSATPDAAAGCPAATDAGTPAMIEDETKVDPKRIKWLDYGGGHQWYVIQEPPSPDCRTDGQALHTGEATKTPSGRAQTPSASLPCQSGTPPPKP